ncbi:nodulation protein NfeD [Streptomyces sp. ACA25]|uniref:NfeD family protein n=1 Tax=Streptomyces sp. ACA25 TaxID=3022596 RepID=UPI002306F558|nr:nodulation protein NfeD [Streptomyces sp. ACA25]MDB1090116.1 nodulation protein NfeD [Streptomyces sp. ACA25]
MTTSMGRTAWRTILGLFVLVWLVITAGGAVAQQQPAVLLARVDSTITQVTADHLESAVREADRGGYDALLVELDTPGGLDTAMREIIQEFLDAPVPVLVHVAPAGARATSAGALITLSSHVAAMAPGTSIGAATPVELQGGDGAAGEKAVNDTAAYAVSVAEQRGRNVEFAEEAVRDARSVSAAEAVDLEVVDLLAADRATLLSAVDGRQIVLGDGSAVELSTTDAAVTEHGMSLFQNVLQLLADPDLAFLFLALGVLAVLFEVASPGVGIGGALGVILLILGFFALNVLPVNAAGVALLLLAGALFLGELFTPGVGVFAAGGSVALLFGGLFLFEGAVEVSPQVLVPATVAIGLGAVLAGRLALRAGRTRPASGAEALVGRQVVLGPVENGRGRAGLDGTSWQVRGSHGQPLREGAAAEVVSVDGITLIVEPCPEEGGEQ